MCRLSEKGSWLAKSYTSRFRLVAVSLGFALLLTFLLPLLVPTKLRSCFSLHDRTRTSSCSCDCFRFIAIKVDQVSAPSYGGSCFSI
ncbi:unnamed protein product [Citrullus colocynthis]|uniref:Uncharacterized protein n=1 Tax=Citrullus colocynthis TaxID=252529 RepID=A0ABP0ZHK6_9ROSI